jgi:ribosomal protein L34E
MSQGDKRGERCWRPQKDNGYCGKHQAIAAIEKGVLEGLHKCSTYRCVTMLEEGVMRCSECLGENEERLKEKTICRGRITQGPNRGSQCDKEASTLEGFCGKHVLNIIVEDAASEGKRICDDGKRACKNYTDDRKLKCEECLEIIREKERAEHVALRGSGKCLGCGSCIIQPAAGFRKENVQRCNDCYEKLKDIEKKRLRQPRNYRKEFKENLERYYADYQTSARKRGILFDLEFDTFCEITSKPCEYCNVVSDDEVNGIDRVDNNIGYVVENAVACCGMCNKMKSDYTFDEFKKHICRIHDKISVMILPSVTAVNVPEIKNRSYKRPKEILSYYSKGTLGEYIELCRQDGRAPSVMNKFSELSKLVLTEHKARDYIKNILKSETKTGELNRKHINKKEMFGYLKLRNVPACVDHYAKVHGSPDGFRNDIQRLVDDWNSVDDSPNEKEFTRILVKYQNKRNA